MKKQESLELMLTDIKEKEAVEILGFCSFNTFLERILKFALKLPMSFPIAFVVKVFYALRISWFFYNLIDDIIDCYHMKKSSI